MKNFKRLAGLTGAILALALGARALAQPPGFGGAGFPNVDPQQMQNIMQQLRTMDPQQMQDMMQQFQNMDPQQRQGAMQQFLTMDPQQMLKTMEDRTSAALREEMGVAGDADWSAIQERIKAVTKARAAVALDGASAMVMGGMRGGMGGGRGGAFAGLANRLSPEAQALQAAIEAKAPNDEIKNLMAKLREARGANLAALGKAQGDLRSLLTFRQEVVAVIHGLLD